MNAKQAREEAEKRKAIIVDSTALSYMVGIERHIKEAIDRGEFQTYYEFNPYYDVAHKLQAKLEADGFEVMLHPHKGMTIKW